MSSSTDGFSGHPKDNAPAAYQDFNAALNSVRLARLASEVARLRARFVIKDSDESLKGAAWLSPLKDCAPVNSLAPSRL
jgi:hypothetical protein